MGFKKIDDDTVKHTYDIERTVKIPMYWEEADRIKQTYNNIPKKKTEPDQETLDFWNEMNVSEEEIESLRQRARYMIGWVDEMIAQGAFPDKWRDEYNDFKDWVNKNLL
jgi:hypothetical protein